VLRRGATLETLAAALHIEWMGTVKYAQVWGNGKFDGQHVSRTYVLEDGDTIELRM
jgi:ribosome-interacting GTPase 1